MNYYNEIAEYPAAWLHALVAAGQISEGVVDDRSIQDVSPQWLGQYRRCHFFAGIGGWDLALQLAGWPDDIPVWTGSCPCQPFSQAGRGGGFGDDRHLWPEWFRLIRECRPPVVLGEQVASRAGLEWLDLVFADLEGAGYACGAADLCAAGVGAPHIRQRLFWVAYRCGHRLEGAGERGAAPRAIVGGVDRLPMEPWGEDRSRFLPHRTRGYVLTSTGALPLAHGLPRSLGRLRPWERRMADVAGCAVRSLKDAKRNRRGRISGYGNAIVPQVAAAFVRAVMDELHIAPTAQRS